MQRIFFTAPTSVCRFLAELEMKLQLTAEDVESALESNSSRLIQRIPLVMQEVVRVKVRGYPVLLVICSLSTSSTIHLLLLLPPLPSMAVSVDFSLSLPHRVMSGRYRKTHAGYLNSWMPRTKRPLPCETSVSQALSLCKPPAPLLVSPCFSLSPLPPTGSLR